MTADALPVGSLSLKELPLDPLSLTPLSPEVLCQQATINIGTIGHVAHGKSTVVKAISGVQTVRFKNELERNITIKLGYANAKIYKCMNPECKPPACYKSFKSDKDPSPPCERPGCGGRMRLERYDTRTDRPFVCHFRHISFVDCPGHDILMATMLNGAAVMDAALLLIAGNEPCPQPQTSEHLAAVQIMKLRNIIILQNKMDLIKESAALEQHAQIAAFVKGTPAEQAPIIPISGQLKYNIDVVCEYLCTKIPVPLRDFSAAPKMIIIRSFDVNKPGSEVRELRGGVAGGSILCGVLRVGDEIEVRPGITQRDGDTVRCRPLYSRVVSLFAENNDLKFAVPGGLIGVGTLIDPTLCRADRLVGQVLGLRGSLPSVFIEIDVQYHLLRRLLGVRSDSGTQTKVSLLEKAEIIMVNIGSFSTGGKVTSIKKDTARIQLFSPACTEVGEKLALSRRIDRHWRLIGWGNILGGTPVTIHGS